MENNVSVGMETGMEEAVSISNTVGLSLCGSRTVHKRKSRQKQVEEDPPPVVEQKRSLFQKNMIMGRDRT
jgi:hypothetical protein